MNTKVKSLSCMALTFVLLFASLHSHSEDIDIANADYCIDWKKKETEFDSSNAFGVRLVFMKKNSDLKYTQAPIKCISSTQYTRHHSYGYSADFYFIDELNQNIATFKQVGSYYGGAGGWIDGRCGWYTDCNEAEYLEARTWTLPMPQIDFPPATHSAETPVKFKKDDLLQFKNKIVNANINLHVRCWPDLDTTYRIGFRAKITGECGCDSTEYKKDTRKNKK